MEVLTPSNIISVVALLVAGASCIYTRRSVLTAHRPYLRSWLDGTKTYSKVMTLWIENKGNGPAIVRRFRLQKPGQYPSDEFSRNVRRQFSYYFQKGILREADIKVNSTISKDEAIPLVEISLENMEAADHHRAYEDLKSFDFFLDYTTLSNTSHTFKSTH